MTLSTMPTLHAIAEAALPAEDLAALLPPGWPLDTPLARVRTCGPLTVEVVTELQSGPDGQLHAVYGPPAASLFAIRGMSTALVLLALLASQPGCLASKDFLMQTLAHLRAPDLLSEEDDQDEDEPLKRLDNVVSLLRKLLCPPVLLPFPGVNLLRKRLVRLVRATPESGSGYRLASFPLLWLDVEAMETYGARARRLEEHGEDGLEDWQAVYQIGMRGPFLSHEPYSAWADWRRGQVTELLWQSVSVQGQRALRWEGGPSGLEAAARLLLAFWQAHVTNEDAFRALVEVLGRQERLQQVEDCYTRLCAALEREGRLPQPRTQETMTALRLAWAGSRAGSLGGNGATAQISGDATTGDKQEALADRLLPETRHLIGREAWLRGICQMVQGFPAKKLLIVQGPIGIGKSSELTRLAERFQQASARVIWLRLPAADRSGGPEVVLDVVLGTVLSQCGVAPFPAEASRERRIAALLAQLRQETRPTVILLDNAECLLQETGALATCWEAFLTQWVRSRHPGSVLLATNEWQGWPGRENLFVAETMVPPLTLAESVCLLQRQGLEGLPVEQLQAVAERMSGIPLLLEWTVRLLTDPLLLNDWRGFDEAETLFQAATAQQSMAKRLQRLLDDPTLLGEHLASRLAPLLQRIMEKHLSDEARLVLARLAVTPIPLGKPALQVLCPRPRFLKELRDASLLAAYTNRVQLLPVVAATIQQHLSPEQWQEAEDAMIQAYRRWLDEGNMELRETGNVVTESAILLLAHHRILEAAELLVDQGWLSFQCGYGSRLALLAREVLNKVEWHQSIEEECIGLVLVHILFPFLGKPFRTQTYGDYPRLRDAFLAGEMSLSATLERSITHLLIQDAIESVQFEQGQAIIDAYRRYLQARQIEHPEQRTGLIQEQALLLGVWCDYLLEQHETERAFAMREETIALYRYCVTRFAAMKTSSPVVESIRKNALAYTSAYLGYHLNQSGQPEEALQMIEQALRFHERGYGYTSILADSYSEKAQALMALGRFQEALQCDEQAITEIHRWAEEGDIYSQDDVWIYQVNRGRLYVRLGRMEEAEQLLQEAEPRISQLLRRNYRMFAKQALEEIAQWQQQTGAAHHQLDWRWVERFRTLTSYDSYWWLNWAGPFIAEEQHAWDRLIALPQDEATQSQLGALMTASRERELEQAFAEQREPRLHYPAIDSEDIRRRIKAEQELLAEVTQQEPNIIVRKLYQEAIADELDYLHLIEATYEGKTERFWECAQRLNPLPSREEVIYALGYVQDLIERGLAEPAAVQTAQQFQDYLATQLHLSPNLLAEAADKKPLIPARTSSASTCSLSAQAAQRFFATVLQESGFEGWQVMLDSHGGMPRVERGARIVFLPDRSYPLADIRHLFVHELAGHVGYCVAGERSPLGLLGLQMKNSGPVQEGIALYHERQILASRGEVLNDIGLRLGMIGVGLAAGVITPPHPFSVLCSFFEQVSLLNFAVKAQQAEPTEAWRRAARQFALDICLRMYRGVPDLERAGVCYPQDVIHLRGLRLVEQAVAADASVLDRLVGVCPLEHLPDLQELGILSAPQPLLQLAYTADLDEYICSFEASTEEGGR